MRIPLSWLQEYIPLSLTPEKMAHMLTMAGLEVDHYETIGENLREVVVARVVETHKHPNADKLKVATVSDGQGMHQIVCGAPNCREGMKTAFAPIGTTLREGHEVLTIQKTKIRGVESEGMLCSEKELGISDEHEGIIELPNDFPEGSSLYDIFADTYFDISLTPNLSHCSSVFGVARELAALTEQPFHVPPLELQEGAESIADALHIRVMDQEGCPRYACRLIQNVKVSSSPDWLKVRLEKCGLRSVNNVVDVTNYLLLEMGHPLHAFDYDKVQGKTLIVRKANEGENIQTLDGKERILKETMLVISDALGPLAIAGILGGNRGEIHDNTRHILLESAYFDPVTIRRTSKQLALQTDASKRFERGTDPNQVLAVLDRATTLIQHIAGGEIFSGVIDIQAKEFPEVLVSCRLSQINQVLGTAFSRGEVEEIFKRLQFSREWDGQDQFKIRIPTYRIDIKAEIDLIEEVARLYGYDHIPRGGGSHQASSLPSAPIYLFEKEVRSRLIGEGLQEFLTCDLIGPALLQVVQDHSLSPESLISVLNPTSIEQSILRSSLLPGLLQVVKYNVDHQNHSVAGFEVGQIHFRDGEKYKEQSVAGIILMGQARPCHWSEQPRDFDFFDLKGMVENLLNSFGIANFTFRNLALPTFHSGRQASVFVDSLELGSIGEIHPAIQRRLDVPLRLLFGEFNLHDILRVAKPMENVKPLAIYPSSERDWTFTVKTSVPFARISEVIHQQASPILEALSLKDVYRHEKLGPSHQNMTLHFVYRDCSKTIEQKVVETEHRRLTQAVLGELGDAVNV